MNTRSKVATAAFAAMLATAPSVNVTASGTPLPDDPDHCVYLDGGLPYPLEPGTGALEAKIAQAAGTEASSAKPIIGGSVSMDQLNNTPLSEITVGCFKAILAQVAYIERFPALSGISWVPPACACMWRQ